MLISEFRELKRIPNPRVDVGAANNSRAGHAHAIMAKRNEAKMDKKRSFEFFKLLHDIEYEIGTECYNGNIQNFGPGGVWEGEGRDFRYPVRFTTAEGKREKYKGRLPYTKSSSGEMAHCILGEERFNSAHYAFGANELYVLRGIKHALEKLEGRFGIDFDELLAIGKEMAKKP